MHYGRDDRAGEGRPKWQRARIITSKHWPDVVGHEIWVRSGPPIETEAYNVATGDDMPRQPFFEIAILSDRSTWSGMPARNLELLARDENDFADDVELIPWQDFLAECRKEQEPHA